MSLAPGTRLDVLDGPVSAVLPSVAAPGVDPDPLWVIAQRHDHAIARIYGRQRKTLPALTLRHSSEPPPLWLGPPLKVDDNGIVVLAWSNGPTLRVVWLDASGEPARVLEASLPGVIRRGAAVGDREGGVGLLLQVTEKPQELPGDLPRLGSADARPDAGPPLHSEFLWLVRSPAEKPPALGKPVRLAAVPAGTSSLIGHSGGEPELWGVEREGRKASAFLLPLAFEKGGAVPGPPRRFPVAPQRDFGTDPVALSCKAQGVLRLGFLEADELVVADAGGESFARPLQRPRPDFMGFAGGRVLLRDPQRGLWLLE
jgi:hypothetical protein